VVFYAINNIFFHFSSNLHWDTTAREPFGSGVSDDHNN